MSRAGEQLKHSIEPLPPPPVFRSMATSPPALVRVSTGESLRSRVSILKQIAPIGVQVKSTKETELPGCQSVGGKLVSSPPLTLRNQSTACSASASQTK